MGESIETIENEMKMANSAGVGTNLSAVVMWVGVRMCAAEPHAL
jgi:hypothetical protein